MDRDSDGRKQVDLTKLPAWAQWLIALGTVALVSGIALLVGKPTSTPGIPVSAIIAAVIAFAFVAWKTQH